MPPLYRSIEVHRLTLSGLSQGTAYGSFLRAVYRATESLSDRVYESGTKSHALNSLSLNNSRLRMRFLSFTTGFRPDILDTDEFVLHPNPLLPTQTGVTWTHVLGGRVGGRYVLLVEKVQSGIAPGILEGYLQWLIDENYQSEDDNDEPVTVSLEYEPGEEFLTRLNQLTRITKASVRTVRPNPGWGDLENELADQSEASDAHKAEVTFTARRSASLSTGDGVIAAIRELFLQQELDYAAVEGDRGDRRDSFNTARLGRRERVQLDADEKGQVIETDAWTKLGRMLDGL